LPRGSWKARIGNGEDYLQGVFRSFDRIGDIIVTKIPPELEEKREQIGRLLLDVVPGARLVLRVSGQTERDTRVRPMEVIAGEGPTLTCYRENDATYVVDVAKVFFTPRLAQERWRVAKQVSDGERVLNAFAGAGCFSIQIARRKAADVYSLDINQYAIECMRLGVAENKMRGAVYPILADARRPPLRDGSVDRVILPLPALADQALLVAVRTLGEMGYVHHYREVCGRRSEVCQTSEAELESLFRRTMPDVSVEVLSTRIVRSVGRLRWHIVHDLLCSKPGEAE